MHGVASSAHPTQAQVEPLFGDEYRFTNAPNLGDILLPVRDTYVIFISRPRLPPLDQLAQQVAAIFVASHSPRLSLCSASAAQIIFSSSRSLPGR
jgi:hypothetical protein